MQKMTEQRAENHRKLKKQLNALGNHAGVYLFFNDKHEALYIGKAKQLKKRLSSYFRQNISLRIEKLMQQVVSLETISTETENQALLLESNLIKQLKPRYNILLRDDKSYPYIIISEHPTYPRLAFYRGPRLKNMRYFGPYPSIGAVRFALNLLQKLFRLRSCQDTFFHNRSRPCLQYQIKRCTAPCVSLITPQAYQNDVKHAELFLKGESQQIIESLIKQMETAASELDFETASYLRDQIAALREIQQNQIITTGHGDVDVIGFAERTGTICLYVMQVRQGQLIGGKAYFPKVPKGLSEEEVLSGFLTQFYFQTEKLHRIPAEIVMAKKPFDQAWLLATLREQAKRHVKLIDKPTKEKRHWLGLAKENAKQALQSLYADKQTFYKQLLQLQKALQLDSLPQRLECFDISHHSGEATVASCVVFDTQGPRKMDYRRFNIHDVTPGDDYAALRQALMRRYSRLKMHEENLPEVVFIDGGKGQLKQATEVMNSLQITGILLIGVAKGEGRKPGLETLFLIKDEQSSTLRLPADSPALHAIQQLRDEAHRFALSGHRGRRAKKRHRSPLEDIAGIGSHRRRELLRQFGGLQGLKAASVDEIARLPGISKTLAERIYFALKD